MAHPSKCQTASESEAPLWEVWDASRSVFCLVSLVSAWGRNWRYLCGRIERVETGETVEIANVDAGFVHVAENMVGWQKRLGEYPTLFSTPLA